MKKLLVLVLFGIALYGIVGYDKPSALFSISQLQSTTAKDSIISEAYDKKLSNIQVEAEGVVVHILRDDKEGRRHQKFLLKLDNGQTLLISHNIDIAPRIDTLQKGDQVRFNGEYEWNNKGGLVHWTHHDPSGHHKNGWLVHNEITYQ